MNPLAILDLTSDLSFKVIGDFQGQSYTKHAISALLLPIETGRVGSARVVTAVDLGPDQQGSMLMAAGCTHPPYH